ncbi:hypothetical protein [Corynebacterium matruchotii]|uniref:hypothetical protein n=1 Tax=Corynebacterium matruchotii TaxID=43768 RepID=UPI0028ED6F83|nr:hypothetical protein [Corynebacterium matruchotii]
MAKSSLSQEQKMYDTALNLIGTVAKTPLVKVDREQFLRQQFANSPYLKQILLQGPQSVYKPKVLEKKARAIVRSNTNKTSAVSFATGLPANPFVMVPAAGADVAQYFGFALHMAQQIAYLFGEDELFTNGGELTEEAKVRVIAYLGVMFGAAGASSLITQTSKVVGQNVGKKVAGQALTKTTWYPLVKKIGVLLGQKITKKTVEKTISKAVPLLGGVVSGGLTFATFRSMGFRLTDEFFKLVTGDAEEEMELNPEFLASIVDVVDVDDSNHRRQ